MSSLPNPHIWKFKKAPKCYPKKICFVDKMETSLFTLAENLGLPVLESEPNNNQVIQPERGTIYVIKDFEDNPVLMLLQGSPDIWIFGPTFLEEFSSNISLELRSQPTYCTSMYGLCFHINCPGNIPLMERMVRLIKWMGGLFVQSPNSHVTHMVTTSSRAKGYIYCWTFNVPIMTTQWVEYCWQQRCIVGFKAALHTDGFELPAFADLHLCFLGFNSAKDQEMKYLTKENGGSVVLWGDPACTHMIFNDNHAVVMDEAVATIPSRTYLVSPDWFWSSLQIRHRTREDDYQICVLTCPFMESYINMDVLQHKPEEYTKEDKAGSPCSISRVSKNVMEDASVLQRKDAKKKYNFEELYQTELNYLRCLKTMVNVKYAALDAAQPGGPIICKAEAKVIFGNFEQILKIHQELAKRLEENLNEWENDTRPSMHEFIKAKNNIFKEYEIYSKNVEDSQRAYEKCENENYSFKELTTSNIIDNQNLKYVFVRPFQRLCSIFLLLSEMKKNNRENSKDKILLTEATDMIKNTLEIMNEKKTMSDNLKVIFDIFYRIENCPPDLITSHREFIAQFSAQEIKKKYNLYNSLGISVTFFLFNDVLVATKSRKTQASKPYKYIVKLSLCMIVKILHFEEEENGSKVFGFIIRDLTNESNTTTCCFQYAEEGGVKLDCVLQLIAKQLSLRGCSKSADEYIVKEIPAGRISVQPITDSVKNKSPPASRIVKLVTSKFLGITKTQEENKPLKRKSASCSELDILKRKL